MPYKTKTLLKAIMKRFELKAKSFNNSTIKNRINTKSRKTFVSSFIKKKGENFIQI